jgi:hypothetical protein
MNTDTLPPVFETLWSAQYGKDYDRGLMDALSHLIHAEEFARMDFETLEVKVDVGDGKATGECWNREWALANLESARNDAASIRSDLEEKHGARKASAIWESHFKRLEEWDGRKDHESPEIAVIVTAYVWLREADGGAVPCASRINALIESIRAYGPLFVKSTSESDKQKLLGGNALAPMNYVAWNRAFRTPHTEGQRKPSAIYIEELIAMARFVFDKDLFPGKVRAERWLKNTPLRLTPGSDKSSSLFGAVKARKTPRR